MIYRFYDPDNFVTKHNLTVTIGWQDSSVHSIAELFTSLSIVAYLAYLHTWQKSQIISFRIVNLCIN